MDAVLCNGRIRVIQERVMIASDNVQKHALQCMRFAADCTQMANDAHDPIAQAHFAGMAKVWSNLAMRRPGAYPGTMQLH